MCQNADIGPVRPEGHPRMFVRPVVGGRPGIDPGTRGEAGQADPTSTYDMD